MPLVAHSQLPTFGRLKKEGLTILSSNRAFHQDIRALHIGLLNIMPDAALAATERQFFRLVGESNQIAQFYMHVFTLPELTRSPEATAYVDQHYESFARIEEEGLDALIITGANVTQPDLSAETFWEPLIRVINWARDNVTSTLCSCLATHAVLQHLHGIRRRRQQEKRWGVYRHRVVDHVHPLVNDVNTQFDVPHSRFNDISLQQFKSAGLHVLVESDVAGVHLAVSEDRFRMVYFQGHPEYDTISLLKEYKREVMRFANGDRGDYPRFPENYLSVQQQAILEECREHFIRARTEGKPIPEFPESLISSNIDNTWHDTAEAVVDNWIGNVYQITNKDRRKPFMEGIDPGNPLGLRM